MQVDPIIPKLKPPGTIVLKLNCDILLSAFAFKFDLRRFIEAFSLTKCDANRPIKHASSSRVKYGAGAGVLNSSPFQFSAQLEH